MSNLEKIQVFNTCTGQMEEVLVNKEVYEEYLRGEWRIKKNDQRFYQHQIQFSGLIGGDEEKYENFKEFRCESIIEETVEKSNIVELIFFEYQKLSTKDKEYFDLLFLKELTERECAVIMHVTRGAVHKKKVSLKERMQHVLINNN